MKKEDKSVKTNMICYDHIDDVNYQHTVNNEIKCSEGKSLLPVALYRIPKIIPYEYGLAHCNIPEYIRGSNVDNAEGEKRQSTKTVENIRPDGINSNNVLQSFQ